MAPSVVSHETATAINVSHNEQSPVNGSFFKRFKGKKAVEDPIDDSSENVARPYRGGAVKTPTIQQADDDDDLCAVSPQARASLDAAKSAAQKARATKQSARTDTGRAIRRLAKEEKKSVSNGQQSQQVSRNATTKLCGSAATVAQAVSAGPSRRPSKATGEDGAPKRAVSGAGLGVQSEVPAAKGSALAALQAKKQGKLSVSGKGKPAIKAPSSTTAALKNEPAKSAFNEEGTPVVTSTQRADQSPQNDLRPTIGKLPSRKNGMFANTPVLPRIAAKTATRSHDLVVDTESGDVAVASKATNTLKRKAEPASKPGPLKRPTDRKRGLVARTAAKPPKASDATTRKRARLPDTDSSSPATGSKTGRGGKRKAEPPSKPGSLKRPARDPEVVGSAAHRKPTFQVPESPNGVTDVAKRAVKDNANQANGKQSVAKRARAGPVKKVANPTKPTSKTVTKQGESEDKGIKAAPDTSIHRRGLANDANGVGPEAKTLSLHHANGKGNISSRHKIAREQETLEDAEQADMHYDDAGCMQDAAAAASVKNPPSHKPLAAVPISKSTKLSNAPVNDDREQTKVATKTPDERGASLSAAAGASQQQPIELSDREESSSPLPPSPVQPQPQSQKLMKVEPRDPKTAVQGPKTPAAFHSSPPSRTSRATDARLPGLLVDDAARRASIISFSKSGPRNQGSTPALRRVVGLPPNDRSSVPPQRAALAAAASSSIARLEARRRGGYPSSAATSMKSHRSHYVAEESNVAADVSDALSGFMKPSVTDRSDAWQPHQKASTDLNVANDDGRKPQQQRETHEITGGSTRTKQSLGSGGRPHTAVNIAEGEPSPTRQPYNDWLDHGFTLVDDYDGPTLIGDLEPLTKLMSPIKLSVKPTASQIAMPPPISKPEKTRKVHRAPTVPSMLRSDESEPTEGLALCASERLRRKRAGDVSLDAGMEVKRPKRSRADDREVQCTKLLPKPDGEPVLDPKVAMQRPSQKLQPEPSKRTSRKPSRQTSQGSQKVDIHGSPIPAGMDVPDKATALETFWQRADLSSDDAAAVYAAAAHEASNDHPLHPLSNKENLEPPRVHQPEVLSSNSKVQPAPPGEDSQAISGTVIGKMVGKHLLVRDRAAGPPTDPFTSSNDKKRASDTSAFAGQLGQATADRVSQRKTRDGLLGKAPSKDRLFLEFATKRKATASSSSSSNVSDESEVSENTSNILSRWRLALKPHQMNIFDELVNVSHKLVCHLVDRENATLDVINDYRRSGQSLVDQMELTHAQDHRQYADNLRERKKRLRKELKGCRQQLKECTGNMNMQRPA